MYDAVMNSRTTLCFSPASLFKTFTMRCQPYMQKSYICLSLEPFKNCADAILSHVEAEQSGRYSDTLLSSAQAIAHRLSDKIEMPVRVMVELKIPQVQKSHFFEKDPATGEEMVKAGVNADDVWIPTALAVDSVCKFREVVQFLGENKYIGADDVSALNPYIDESEKRLAFNAALISQASTKQEQIIQTFVGPLIKDIVAKCALIPEKEGVCKRDVAFCVLIDSMLGNQATLFGEIFHELCDWACAENSSPKQLRAVYCGSQELELLFKESDEGIPTIEMQREIILDHIEEMLKEQFPDEPSAIRPKDSPCNSFLRNSFLQGQRPWWLLSHELTPKTTIEKLMKPKVDSDGAGADKDLP